MKSDKWCILMILDGWGLEAAGPGNAVSLARTPVLDKLISSYPVTRLQCSGKAVGLPDGIMGNSEVGHMNIGAGRVVFQDLMRIDMAIADGSFFRNEVLQAAMTRVNERKTALHLMGLVSDGGVHSQFSHLLALLDMARQNNVPQVFVHVILDGRDTPPDGGAGYLQQLQEHIEKNSYGAVASICGRYYAMDRDTRWDRIEKAYRLVTEGRGMSAKDPVQAVQDAYARGETDEFVKPIVLVDDSERPLGTIDNGDGVIFFNFRADRAREITRALTDPKFDEFNRQRVPKLCVYACMTPYDDTFDLPAAFPPVRLQKILGDVISAQGLQQLRIAETEKYAHVTYFFNGGEETPFANEDRCLIPSPRDVATYDEKPEMSAFEVTAELLQRIEGRTYDLIVLNFANMDMVGHTGVLSAAIKACETVDACVGRIIKAVQANGGVALITADHGNSEKMLENSDKIHTAHTVNPVPLILVDDSRKTAALREGRLGDIAPTILELMGIQQPEEMTGTSLLK